MPTVLEFLLDPIDPIEFREQYYGKQPLLIRGHAKKFADLFGLADLNRLLNTWPYPHPHVYISHPRKREVAASHTSIIEQSRAGTALIVSKLDVYDQKVGELARALEAETGEPMTISMILSQPAQTVFVTHWDANDVFVLHIDGRKGWSVWDRSIEKPVVDMEEELYARPPHPTIECELAPGDVLYIPRGHWHQALAQTGSSLHLSIVVVARTGIDFLAWLLGELRNDVRFREEFPLSFANEAADVREARVREHVAGLGTALTSRFQDDETVQSFIRHCVASDRDVPRIKFPAQMFETPGAQLQARHFSRPARQRFVLDDGPADDQITLSVWGHTLRFPKSARPLIEFILSRTAFAYEDAQAHAGGLADEGIWEVLDTLLREGILDAADGTQ